jgi:hypothetical protein
MTHTTQDTLEEERREVWTSILESLRLAPDQDREAACRYLLRHLVAGDRRRAAQA